MLSLGSKVVSKSHGIPGVVEEVKKYGGYQFIVVKQLVYLGSILLLA